jgi:uncharacterized membrane protein
MDVVYVLGVWLHVLAAATWVGGLLLIALVLVPILRRPKDPRDVETISGIVRRFRGVGWTSLVLLVLTGLYLLVHALGVRDDPWQGGFAHTLATKLTLVFAILVLGAFHDFAIGPRAAMLRRSAPGSPEAVRTARLAGWLARINVVLTIVVVALGVLLARAR